MTIEKRILAYIIGTAAVAGGSLLVINGLCKKTYKGSKKSRAKLMKNLIANLENVETDAIKKAFFRRTAVKDSHDKYANQ